MFRFLDWLFGRETYLDKWAKKDIKQSLIDATKPPAARMMGERNPNADLEEGNIRPTGVGLREGEIAALDALGVELGAMLESEAIARNALIRIAVRKLITDLRSGVMSYDDLAAYFQIPDKPKPKLNL